MALLLEICEKLRPHFLVSRKIDTIFVKVGGEMVYFRKKRSLFQFSKLFKLIFFQKTFIFKGKVKSSTYSFLCKLYCND